MKKLLKNIVPFFITCCFLSCGEYPCGKASSSLALISFTDAESDTVIIRRFSKSTNFGSLHDTLTLTRLHINFQRQNDTILVLAPSDNGNNIITSDYDYEIFLPKVTRVFRLTEIIENVKYGHKTGQKIYCLNTLSSYKLNGQPATDGNGNNFIYLKK